MQEMEKGKAMVLEGSPHGILQAPKKPGRWVRRSAGMQASQSQSLISNTAAVILPVGGTSDRSATVGTVPRVRIDAIRYRYSY